MALYQPADLAQSILHFVQTSCNPKYPVINVSYNFALIKWIYLSQLTFEPVAHGYLATGGLPPEDTIAAILAF